MTIPRILLFIICSVHFSFVVKAQNNLDSLYSIWQDENLSDSSRAFAFQDYIWKGFIFSKADSAFKLADQLIEFSIQKNYEPGHAKALYIQGVSLYLRGDYSNALEYCERSLAIYEKTGDQKGKATTLNVMGLIYSGQSDYQKALEYYQKIISIYEELNDQNGIAITMGNIGLIYKDKGDYAKALNYYGTSLRKYEETDDQNGIATTLNNFGIIHQEQQNFNKALEYFERSMAIKEKAGNQQGVASSLNNIGLTYQRQNDFPKALEYFGRALVIYEKTGNQRGLPAVLSNLGLVYLNSGDYSKSLDYYERAIALYKKNGDQGGIALVLNNMGLVYQKKGNYLKSIDYCTEGLTMAESIGTLRSQKNGCECLYNTYKSMGRGNEALVFLEKMRSVEDSLQAEEIAKKLEQIEFQKKMLADSLETVENERLVEEAHKEEIRKKNQTRNVAMAGGFFALMLAGGFYSRWRYVRKSRNIISKEKDRSENLLLNILPAEIAEELKEKGRADARDFEMVSILFTDFKGFTAASEKLSAQDLVTEINTYFEAFDKIIGKFGVEKIKTIGDAYMAAGGLPVPSADSVKNTILAALEMQEFVFNRKAQNILAGKSSFDMRVGIHTGPVVAGIVGVKKFQYDIWGDTVNTASRMESSGEIGQVNISEMTYELIKDDPEFIFISRGKIEAKGKGELNMYFVSKKGSN
ncbi:MAG: tetratricopeptide repeat protein [Saprospiraceae bacterium]|nr:tetratricopeptide repeat protein [Saprospiraceae bacterium]